MGVPAIIPVGRDLGHAAAAVDEEVARAHEGLVFRGDAHPKGLGVDSSCAVAGEFDGHFSSFNRGSIRSHTASFSA